MRSSSRRRKKKNKKNMMVVVMMMMMMMMMMMISGSWNYQHKIRIEETYPITRAVVSQYQSRPLLHYAGKRFHVFVPSAELA